MGTSTLISVAEYLRSSYEPDADFVDGVLEERSLGEIEHSALQRKLMLLLSQPSFEAFFLCYPELRVQVSETNYRVPDLCLLAHDAPYEKIILTPPLLCIEILSPEDTMARTLAKVRDFLTMGIPEVWVLDPESRTVQVCRDRYMTEHSAGVLEVPNTPATLSLSEAFSILRQAK